jgi:hypothetical protein
MSTPTFHNEKQEQCCLHVLSPLLQSWGDLPAHRACEQHLGSDGTATYVVYWPTRLTAIICAKTTSNHDIIAVTVMDYLDIHKQDAALYRSLEEARQPLLNKLERLREPPSSGATV